MKPLITINQSILTGVFATVVVGLMASASLSAATIVEYTFDSNTSATTVDANLDLATVISGGSGITAPTRSATDGGTTFVRASDTSTTTLTVGTAITNNDYLSFSVDVAAGYQMDLTSLVFDFGYTAGANYTPDKQFKAYLFTSVDGFVDSGDIVGSDTIIVDQENTGIQWPGEDTTIALSDARFQGLTGSTEFRIYLADTTGDSNHIHRFDDITLNGEVAAIVPEPGNFALIGGLLALGWLMIRRRA
ncbi:MAG: PEP-CTERM sorting domain-containing protein [Opitutae bacterium]|nr:PEP-CTERM sorting domain-containing protein [Opitutae bacterium]MDG1300606.1 PEP-CTERM sorting domain-containing protein [Opitutae bacterium]